MTEFYDDKTLPVSRRIYSQIREWGQQGGVTLIGGWAVYEQVDPMVAQQSRDIDLIIHDEKTLWGFNAQLANWGLQWRRKGRNTFNDCHLIGGDPMKIFVDVFKASDFKESLLGGPRVPKQSLVKAPPTLDWLPDVDFLIKEKLMTIPRRQRDVEDKRLKDFIDVYHLAFYNKQDKSARELAEANPDDREMALQYLDAARRQDNERRGGLYQVQLDHIEAWLRA